MISSTLVKPGTRVDLSRHDPEARGGFVKNSPEVRDKMAADLESICELQGRLYAEGKQALLIVLQGLDTAGKDGTISHVMSGVNPQGCTVAAFKVPTPQEATHDFLWRVHARVPARSQIAVFNRSHYEDVLAARVHGIVPPAVWRKRYRQINDFELLLSETGTRILKLYLHISKDEQKRRLEERLQDPKKQWKFSPADLPERARWDDYMKAYEDLLSRCSTEVAPWHIVPANHKWYRNLVVADLVAQTLRSMKPKWPAPRPELAQLKVE